MRLDLHVIHASVESPDANITVRRVRVNVICSFITDKSIGESGGQVKLALPVRPNML